MISKLPIRQFTYCDSRFLWNRFSKLPIRQFTIKRAPSDINFISKLPIRQFTVPPKHFTPDTDLYY